MKRKEAILLQSYHRFTDRQHPADYRQEEIQALKRAIRATENRLVLSMPDVGLSNLLRFLVTRTDWGNRRVTFAYIDCDALGDCLDRELFFAEIVRQFREQGVGKGTRENAPGYEQLKWLLTEAGGDRSEPLVIVVNKTDRMLAAADEAFYRKLKALADHNKRVCYIFGADLSVADMVDPAEPLLAGRWLWVGRFNERDFARAVAEEARRLEVDFDATSCEQLGWLTRRHPGLLRAVSSAVIEEQLDLLRPEMALVERLLARGDVASRCQRVWQALNSTQQAALQAIAGDRADAVGQNILTWLQKSDLVVKQGQNYQLFSPIFQQFVAAQEIRLEWPHPGQESFSNFG